MSPAGPHLYDLLDVDPSASPEQIRAAWKAAIEDLDPTDRRFRVYNQAAETLLDPERRRAYDAQLAAEEEAADAEPDDSPAWTGPADPAEPPVPEERVAPTPGSAIIDLSRRRVVPGWLLVALAIWFAVAAGVTVYLFTQPSEAAVEEATSSARTAAETAIEPLLSYDYRTLDQDKRDAERYLTADYRRDYDKLFAVIEENAPGTRTVVEAQVLDSAVVRAGDDRVQILLFVNRPTTNKVNKEPVIYKDQVTVTMQQVDGRWLVDGLVTSPPAK